MYKRKKDKKQQLSEYGDSVYAAEKLLDKRRKHGRTEYLVLWRGWALSDSTWEPIGNILDDRLIEEFEKNRTAKKDSPKAKKSIPQPKQAKEKATKSDQKEEEDSTCGEADERNPIDNVEVSNVADEPSESPTNEEKQETREAALKDEPTSAIESDGGRERAAALQPDQLTVQVEEANEQEEAFEVILESDEEESGGCRPEREAESGNVMSGHLLMAVPEICSPKIATPSATITRNPMLFNQLVNKKIASPNKDKPSQAGLIQQTDLLGSLSPVSRRRNAFPSSFRSTVSQSTLQSTLQSQAPPKSVLISRSPTVKQVHLVHSLRREEPGEQQYSLNSGLDSRLVSRFEQEPSFTTQSRLTNSRLINSLTGNHPQTQSSFYSSSPSHSPSASYHATLSHQFKQITNPTVNGRQLSSPFRGSHSICHPNSQCLVNVAQPITSEAPDFSHMTQQQSAPPVSRPPESRPVNDRQAMNVPGQLEADRLKSFQETSNAILNSKRLVKRPVVPPSIFWRQNTLVNQIVITDVINNDNVEVTIRECKKKEFFTKGKKKKMKHKLKMMKLI